MIHADNFPNASPTDIAIVGMAGRFPGATNLAQFWENIRAGTVSITHFTEEELLGAGVSATDLASPNYIRVASRLDDAEDFDADYFNFSPVEANFIDPQHRIFLESSVEALEDAGCDPQRFGGHIGVFAGCALNIRHLSRALSHFDETLGEPQLFTILANDKDYLATRLSYKLNLTGPSINLQAACSTSLVAVHLACQSLINGECDAAIAGGASVVFSYAKLGYRFSEGSVFSADGTCRPFDAEASGTVFGDGVGVVVLKRLNDALADGDNIRAIIKGSAINNDGARKASFAAPSISGQAGVIAEAIAMAGIPADTIGFIEAHGTGTAIGDPIEVEGLKRVFGASALGGRCALGSVKGNVGHLNAAAGVAGLIKTVLALEHSEIPPTAQFTALNPKIEFAGTPFFIADRALPWEDVSAYRRAGVSSFGIGGTNAHIIVEAAPKVERPNSTERRDRAYLFSARTAPALDQLIQSTAAYLDQTPAPDMADLALTLAEGRTRHSHGFAIVGSDAAQLALGLRTPSPAKSVYGKLSGDEVRVALAFPGQGSQCLRMGLGVYCREPVYKAAFDRCLAILRSTHAMDLGMLFGMTSNLGEGGGVDLNRTDYAQPAIFSTAYALAQLWLSWGVKPCGLIGHSLGELVAACVAGVFSLDDALGLIVTRGRLMNAAEPGAMIAVMATPEQLASELGEELSIASYNGANACVVAGPFEPIETLQSRLIKHGLPCTKLKTSHAFHTDSMAGAVTPFAAAVAAIKTNPPQIPFVSNVTGDWITAEQATSPSYWADQILQPVRFAQGITTLTKSFKGVLLEVGPGRQLTGLASQLIEDQRHLAIPSLPRPGQQEDEHGDLLRGAASLALAGIDLDWSAINRTGGARKVIAPKYPFQRRTYSLGTGAIQPHQKATPDQASALGDADADTVKLYEPDWQRVNLEKTALPGSRRWLILGAGQQLCARLHAEFFAAGDEVIEVTNAADFQNADAHHYCTAPGNRQHLEALVEHLTTSAMLPDAIIYARSLDPAPQAALAVESAYFDITGLVTLIKAVDFDRQVDVFLLAANGQDIFGTGEAQPASSALLGLSRSLPEELDALSVRYVDLDAADLAPLQIANTVADLAPVFAGNGPRILALRNRRFFVPTLGRRQTPVQLPKAVDSLVRDGAWLITGGLGGIGLALAHGLANRGTKRIALLSRRELPPRSDWVAIIKAGTADAPLLESLRELEAKGVEIALVTADVADRGALEAAFAQARRAFGKINALIHCAGTVDGGQAATKASETALKVIRPKVAGTLNIAAITAEDSLELLVLCSSVTTLLNNPGQTDYAAANAFLDSFAASANSSTGRVVAINWDSWTEVGMAASYSVPEAFRETRDAWLKGGLLTEEAVRAFFDALGTDATRIVVTKLGLTPENSLLPALAPHVEAAVKDVIHPRPDLTVAFVAPRSAIETTAARIMAEMLNLQTVGIDDNFLDLGCHSLTATRFAAKMRQETGVIIPLATLFDGLTLRTTMDALELEEFEEGVI